MLRGVRGHTGGAGTGGAGTHTVRIGSQVHGGKVCVPKLHLGLMSKSMQSRITGMKCVSPGLSIPRAFQGFETGRAAHGFWTDSWQYRQLGRILLTGSPYGA